MGIFDVLSAISLVPLVGMVVVLPLAVYLVARARDGREGRGTDPQLGAKTALGFFQTLGFMAALGGIAAIIAGIGYETRMKELWAAIAMVVVGGSFFGLHTALLGRTNQRERPSVSRLYWGLNYIATGAASFVGLSLLVVSLGRDRFEREAGYAALAMVLVYLPTWIVLTVRLVGNLRGAVPPPEGAMGPPPRPQAPPQAPAAPIEPG
jgi:hypothetical protein